MSRLPWLAALLAILVYLPTLSNGFIRDNDAHLAEPGWLDRVGLAQAFTDNSWHVVYEARYYRPLVLASHKLDAALYGTSAWGLHLTNVLLYAALCALLALLLAELECPPGWRAALCVLFVVHPAHAECVAWISGRSDLMAGLAGGAALWAAWRGQPVCSGVLLLASLLSKEVGAAFALTLFLAALARRDRALGLAIGAAVAVYAGLRAAALGSPAAGAGAGVPGGTEIALMAVLALKMAGRYLTMMLTGATWGAFSWDEVVARHHMLGTPDLTDHLALELDAELVCALAALMGTAAAVVWLRRARREVEPAASTAAQAGRGCALPSTAADAGACSTPPSIAAEADPGSALPSTAVEAGPTAAEVSSSALPLTSEPRARELATLASLLGVASLALSFTALRFADKLNFADRYVFVPTFALALALGARIRSGLALRTCVAVLCVSIAWTAAAADRSARYRDPVAFAEGAVRDNPLSGVAWQMLAQRRAEAHAPVSAWDAKLRALALHGELVPVFDVNSGESREAYVTAVINAARWRTGPALDTLSRASKRRK